SFTFVATVTIIPFMPNGWDPAAGFPAMTGNVAFLMKDVVLLAASIYLLKQDLVRVSASAKRGAHAQWLRAYSPPVPATPTTLLRCGIWSLLMSALGSEFNESTQHLLILADEEVCALSKPSGAGAIPPLPGNASRNLFALLKPQRRLISRLTVEGDRSRPCAIRRIDRPATVMRRSLSAGMRTPKRSPSLSVLTKSSRRSKRTHMSLR